MARIVQYTCRDTVDQAAVEAVLGGLGAVTTGAEEYATVQFLDSFDDRLSNHGLVIECARHGEGSTLALRHADGDFVAALEISGACPRSAEELPASRLRSAVETLLADCALLPLLPCSLRTRRYSWQPEGAERVCEIALHTYVLEDGQARALRLLEVRALRGHGKATRAVGRLLATLLPLEELATDRAHQLALRAGHSPPPAAHSATPLTEDTPTAVAVASALLAYAATMQANLNGIREDIDRDFLHDFRIAMRRSRSLLAAFKGLFDKPARRRFRDDFSWLSAGTGRLRDLDVLLEELDTMPVGATGPTPAAASAVRAYAATHRAREQRAVARLLDSKRYANFTRDWEQALNTLAASASRRRAIIVDSAAMAIERMFERLVLRIAKLPSPPSHSGLHQIRKDCKRLRYLVEAFASLYPHGRSKRIIGDLKRLQGMLGEICDRNALHALLQAWLRRLPRPFDGALYAGLTAIADARATQPNDERTDKLVRRLARFGARKNRARYAHLRRTPMA